MSTVAHAEIVGSLLRPAHLVRAREQHLAGALSAAAYKQVEDRTVDTVVGLQESLDLDIVNDGELRRNSFIDQLTEAVEGLAPDRAGSYDALATTLFRRATNYDAFVLEYDDERSGSFEALRELPDDKIAVLAWSHRSSARPSRPTNYCRASMKPRRSSPATNWRSPRNVVSPPPAPATRSPKRSRAPSCGSSRRWPTPPRTDPYRCPPPGLGWAAIHNRHATRCARLA